MPNKILIEDIIDEMIENINCIKLKTYIKANYTYCHINLRFLYIKKM